MGSQKRRHPLVESRVEELREQFRWAEKGYRRPDGRLVLPGITRVRVAADRVARGGAAVRDGYPGGSTGVGAGVSNPTLAAALDRARPRTRADVMAGDPIGVELVKALAALGQAADALDAFHAALDRVDELTNETPVDVVECAHHRAAGIHEDTGIVFTDLAGALPSPMRLCGLCRGFGDDVKRGRRRPTDGPGGVLPTVDQVTHHATTGRWVIRGDVRRTA